jgi:hypothetical protein
MLRGIAIAAVVFLLLIFGFGRAMNMLIERPSQRVSFVHRHPVKKPGCIKPESSGKTASATAY